MMTSEPDLELSYRDFVRSRKLYWKSEAKKLGNEVEVPSFDEVEIGDSDSNFIHWSPGPDEILAVFEDDENAGWIYLYDSKQRQILKCTHIYNRSRVDVKSEDVDVLWSDDKQSCGVAIWGQFRAFLGLSNGIEMRKPVTARDEDGFCSANWPDGFAHLLLKGQGMREAGNGDGGDRD